MLTLQSDSQIQSRANAGTPPANPWASISIPSLAWARKHPERLMEFLMVAQIDFPELTEMLK